MIIKSQNYKVKGMRRDESYSAFNPEYSWSNKNIRLTARDGNDLLSVTNEKGNLQLGINIIYVLNIKTFSATNIGFNKSTINGYVESTDSMIERGFCYSNLTDTPTINDTKVIYSGVSDNMTHDLTNLDYGGDYFVRSYVIDINNNVLYGNSIYFKTMKVSTNVAELEFYTNIYIGGSINSFSASNIDSVGFCYSKSQNPTLLDSHTIDVVGGSFAHTLIELDYSSTYYIRAYAINSEGTFYGNELYVSTYSPLYEYIPVFKKYQIQTEYVPTYTYSSAFNNYQYIYVLL